MEEETIHLNRFIFIFSSFTDIYIYFHPKLNYLWLLGWELEWLNGPVCFYIYMRTKRENAMILENVRTKYSTLRNWSFIRLKRL